jgi:hypothetical protein
MGHPSLVVGGEPTKSNRGSLGSSAAADFSRDDTRSVGFVVSHPSPGKMRRMGHPSLVVGEGREMREFVAASPRTLFLENSGCSRSQR